MSSPRMHARPAVLWSACALLQLLALLGWAAIPASGQPSLCPDGSHFNVVAAGLAVPADVVVNANGTIAYVIDTSALTLSAVDLTAALPTTATTLHTFAASSILAGVTMLGDTVYMGEYSSGTIFAIDVSAGSSYTPTVLSTALANPVDVYAWGTLLYVISALQVWSLDLTALNAAPVLLMSGLNNPTQVAASYDGTLLFVTSSYGQQLYVAASATGAQIEGSPFATGGFAGAVSQFFHNVMFSVDNDFYWDGQEDVGYLNLITGVSNSFQYGGLAHTKGLTTQGNTLFAAVTGLGELLSLTCLPTVSSLSPPTGPSTGGVPLVINGANFGSAPTVTVGGVPCPVRTSSYPADSVTCTLPAGAGTQLPVALSILVAGNATSITSNLTFSYTAGGGSVGSSSSSPTASYFAPSSSSSTGAAVSSVVVAVANSNLSATTADGAPAGFDVVTRVNTSVSSNNTAMANVTVVPIVSPSTGLVVNSAVLQSPANTSISISQSVAAPSDVTYTFAVNLTSLQYLVRPQRRRLLAVLSAAPTSGVFVSICSSCQEIVDGECVLGCPSSTGSMGGMSTRRRLLQIVTQSANQSSVWVDCALTVCDNLRVHVSLTLPAATASLANISVQIEAAQQSVAASGLSLTGVALPPAAPAYSSSSSSSSAPPVPAAVPLIQQVSPTSGLLTAGGGGLTIVGSGFGNGFLSTLLVDGLQPVVATYTTSKIVLVVPPGPAGHSLAIALAVDGQPAQFASGYVAPTYATPVVTSLPTLVSVTPLSGPTVGGTTLTLQGSNFGSTASAVTVTVGGHPCTSLAITSAAQNAITCSLPAGQGTAQSVVLSVGSAIVTSTSTFSYSAPTLLSVQPFLVSSTGGSVVSLTGANLGVSGAVVLVNGSPVSALTQNATSVTFVMPAGTGDLVPLDVIVGGQTTQPAPSAVVTYVNSVSSVTTAVPATCSARVGNQSVVISMSLAFTGSPPTAAVVANRLAAIYHLSASALQVCVDSTVYPACSRGGAAKAAGCPAVQNATVTLVLPASVAPPSQWPALGTAVLASPTALAATLLRPQDVATVQLPTYLYWNVSYRLPAPMFALQVDGCVTTNGTALNVRQVPAVSSAPARIVASYAILSGSGNITATSSNLASAASWQVSASVVSGQQLLSSSSPFVLSTGLTVVITSPLLMYGVTLGNVVLLDPMATSPAGTSLLFTPATHC